MGLYQNIKTAITKKPQSQSTVTLVSLSFLLPLFLTTSTKDAKASLRLWGIRALITLLRLVAPTAFLFSGYTLVGLTNPKVRQLIMKKPYLLLQIWMLTECWFYFYMANKAKTLGVPTKPKRPPSFKTRRQLLNQCEELVKDPEIAPCTEEEFLVGWFRGAPVSQIRKGNFAEWTAATTFYSRFEDLSSMEQAELKEFVQRQNDNSKIALADGYNPNVRPMKLQLDPLLYIHRPLLLYGVIKICDILTHGYLYSLGFKKYRHNSVIYWYWKNSKKKSRHQTPVVLIHGIGAAFLPYVNMIRKIRYLPEQDRPPAIFLIELPHISMQICSVVPSSHQTVDAIATALNCHDGWSRARFIGHSYGTYVVSWMIKQRPEMVAGAILIDPVCFLTFTPKTAYSFLYKKPITAEDHIIHFFVSRELHIANVLTRHFWWWENCLWIHDIGNIPVTAFISGQDTIVPSQAVLRYLNKYHIPVIYYDNLIHAEFLVRNKPMQDILETLNNNCRATRPYNAHHLIPPSQIVVQ